jgi:hypothetical protein
MQLVSSPTELTTAATDAIDLNLVAAAVQASDVTIRLIVPFDHNGVFHLVQLVAIAALAQSGWC